MKKRTILRYLIGGVLGTALLLVAFWSGAYCGFRMGYTRAERITNTWWIDQKSRYYDSSEVQKKRLAQRYNAV